MSTHIKRRDARILLRILSIALAGAAMAVSLPGHSTPDSTAYSLSARIPGAGGAWDYAVLDAPAHKLFLAQAGVTALDLDTNTVKTGFVAGKTTHGLALVGDGTVAVDDSQTKIITIFDETTGRILSAIPTASFNPQNGVHALDAMVLEPMTGLLVALNGDSGLLLMVDLKQSRVIGTMALGGHAEFAVANGAGTVYVNLNNSRGSEIVAVDVRLRKIVNHIALFGCEEATGLAYDRAGKLLLSVCDNGMLEALDEGTGRVVRSIRVGRGADAVMFDSVHRLAFVASGEDGMLSIIAVRGPHDIALAQTLGTQIGTRLGAVDLATGRVYMPSAKFGPPSPPIPYPAVVPGTFEFLVAVPP
jgi:DNA-binding beta-propeller fold protein YncE